MKAYCASRPGHVRRSGNPGLRQSVTPNQPGTIRAMTMIFSVSARRSIRSSGVDTVLICQLAGQLLATTKDIRIVTYYCWARLHQDGEAGLADGLELLAGLLQRYGMQLYPQRDRSRKAALEWLAGTRIFRQSFTFSRSCAGGRKAYRRRAASH